MTSPNLIFTRLLVAARLTAATTPAMGDAGNGVNAHALVSRCAP